MPTANAPGLAASASCFAGLSYEPGGITRRAHVTDVGDVVASQRVHECLAGLMPPATLSGQRTAPVPLQGEGGQPR